MRRSLVSIALFVCPLALSLAGAEPPATAPGLPPDARALGATVPPSRGAGYHLPTPRGWRRERYEFPLPFAPDLPFRGHVELRAPPGMEDPGSEELWSYALLWWLEGSPALEADGLADALEVYFLGLARSVARGRAVRPPRARVVELIPRGEVRRFVGTLTAADPRAREVAGTLTLRADVLPCRGAGHTAVLFQVSPRPRGHPLWDTLRELREGFSCEGRSGTAVPGAARPAR